ncbi:MAG: hypothetical protein JKY20_13345 [Alphaproteobacteria bacterium]|nr:hypothetical protein [Alphaproteobacteria bacterium]
MSGAVVQGGAKRRVFLRDIAHARAGDKGNISCISVWAYDPKDYLVLKAQCTEEWAANAFGLLLEGSVTRYALDQLHGLNFVFTDALEGGVNGSLNLDGHGKSFSYILLGQEIDMPD